MMNAKSALRLGSITVVGAVFFTVACASNQHQQSGSSSAGGNAAQPREAMTFRGTIRTGAELEEREYCPDGFYLVADGGFLVGQTRMLLLRVPDKPDYPAMLSDHRYVGKHVEVVGKYPDQENFCEALMCECEDYILVERIEIP